MGNRKNGHRVYTQAEYEHFCFSGEPFTGYVEGIGYTCTEVVVTARQINRSGTKFVFDLSYVGYTFDISDMPGEAPQTLSQLEESRNRASGDPDRSKYWKIPTIGKFEYSDEGAQQLLNPVALVDNLAIELINSVVYLANSLINSGQVLYHEGAGSWWNYEWGGFKNQVKDIGDWGKSVYDYHTKTPARQQWTDFKKDISSLESWEKNIFSAGTLALGGYGMASKVGAVGRGTGMLAEPNITVIRGVNSTAGSAYNRALKGVVKPRGGLFGHSDPFLHNAGKTANSRLTSWTTNSDVARSYALGSNGQGVVLQVTVPVSRLIKSPNLQQIILKHLKSKGPVSESEVLLKGTIRKNVQVREIKISK